MAQTYTRQSSLADGDTITAALFNNEYNQLVNAFAYSSSSASSTGHRHDGTAGQGGNIHTIGDLDFLNKIVVDDTNNRWGVFVEVSSAAVEQIRIQDGAIVPVTDSDIDLGTTGVRFKDAYIDSITTTGNVAVGGNLTVTGTTTFNGGTLTLGDAASDNVVFGADVDSNIIPDDDDTYDLGSSSQEWRNLYIDGTANIDSLVADTADINGGTVDGAVIGGSTAAAITGTTITGTTITGTSFVIGSADISEAELETIDGVTAGTVAASKAIVVDSNKDFTGARNITLTGELDAGSLDVSGDVDIDGTLETDALSINGTAVTSTAAELNILDGVTSTAAELNILDGVTSTATELNLLDGVTSTTAELNILDGVTASAADINLIDGITNGTVIASKAIITDANKDITGGRNITISGELDAATLDISGDADIDGTLEADAITIGGVTLAETISDTVGAMVSSNTETNITVTYEDSDNTLDFVIGTLNQDTTGNAATATALETARTIHGVSFDGTANIDLSEVVQDTVGAMFSSNTESGITVDYQDGDGTIDLTVGTLNQNTTGSAATLTTARTIGGVSFDGSANIVPTTFAAATFSGDVNIDSGLLFADVSTNRIGINQASPDVTLDLGANTDAVHVPVGTTAQRPASPAAGYFRYNSTTGDFEGYTDAWGAIAGSGGTAPAVDTMTGDGSDTTLTLTSAPVNENATVLTLDGVVQHKSTYSVSGNTLTFSTAPPSGVAVECITWTNTAINAALLMQDADGDTQIQVEESSDEDKIRFDTGGSERVIIDSTGMGIGTTSPSAPLHVNRSGVGEAIRFTDSITDTGHLNVVSGGGCSLWAGGFLAFGAGGGGSYTERMRIDSSGNVGIGTTSPAVKGEIKNAASGAVATSGTTQTNGVLRLSSSATTGIIDFGMNGSNPFIQATDSTGLNNFYNLNLNPAGGNVGIGTASPTGTLHVAGSGSTVPIKIDNTGTGGDTWRIWSTNDAASDGGGKLGFYNEDTATRAMTLDSSGNVGIGTTSPSAELSVSNSGVEGYEISPATVIGGTIRQLAFNRSTSAYIPMRVQASEHQFYTSGSEAMRIDASGNVGIGTSSPEGITSGVTSLSISDTGSKTTGDKTGVLAFKTNDSSYTGTYSDGVTGEIYSIAESATGAAYGMAFLTGTISGTDRAERVRIDSSGNVGIGTTSPDISGFSKALTIDSSESGIELASSGTIQAMFASNTQGATIHGVGSSGIRVFTSASGSTSERMRIDSSGNMLVGKTSTGDYVTGIEMQPSGAVLAYRTSGVAGIFGRTNNGETVRFTNNSSIVGSISTTGSATAYNTSSDARLKDVTGEARGLEIINALNPVAYNWKSNGQADEGLIAQEVEKIVPNAVSQNEEEYYQMDYSKLVTHLVAGMKEQQEQIEQLKTEIQTLKGE